MTYFVNIALAFKLPTPTAGCLMPMLASRVTVSVVTGIMAASRVLWVARVARVARAGSTWPLVGGM